MSRKSTKPRRCLHYESVQSVVARVRKRMQRLARNNIKRRIARVWQEAEEYRERNDPWSAATLEDFADRAEYDHQHR